MYFEDFEVGELYEHRLRRTVTQMDNMLFSNMTLNPQPLHIDRDFCEKETEWGQPLMNSLFTLGLMVGISGQRHDGRHHHRQSRHDRREIPAPAVRGRHHPLHHRGAGKRESKSRPGAGIVDLHIRAYNQDDKLVAECKRQAFMLHAAEADVETPDALAPLRSRRQREEARQGPRHRRRRADPRPRGFGRGRAQGGGARDGARLSEGARAAREAAAPRRAGQRARHRPDRRRSRRGRRRAARRDPAAEGRRRRRRSSISTPSSPRARRMHGLPDGAIEIIALATETASALFLCGTYAGASKRLTGTDLGRGGSLRRARRRDQPRRATATSPRPTCWRAISAARGGRGARVAGDRHGLRRFPQRWTGLRAECEEARRDGFTAKMAIHPAQVAGHQRGVHARGRGDREGAAP